MSSPHPQYIGVCDFDTRKTAINTTHFFQTLISEAPNTQSLRLMIGMMMSWRSLNEEIPEKWRRVWVRKEYLASVFPEQHRYIMNTVHYADFQDRSTEKDLLSAAYYGGPYLHALQLDMILPQAAMVARVKEMYPHIKIILQINSMSLDRVNNKPQELVHTLQQYKGIVDYILLDKSHGNGIPMNPQELLPFVRSINEETSFGITIAGGLGPYTMHLAEQIATEVPNVSIDMQGRVRKSRKATDPIDTHLVDSALVRSVEMYQRVLR